MRELIFKSPFDITVSPEVREKGFDKLYKSQVKFDDTISVNDQYRFDKKEMFPSEQRGKVMAVTEEDVKKHVIHRRQGVNTNG